MMLFCDQVQASKKSLASRAIHKQSIWDAGVHEVDTSRTAMYKNRYDNVTHEELACTCLWPGKKHSPDCGAK